MEISNSLLNLCLGVVCCRSCLILLAKAGHAFESEVEGQEFQVTWEALDIQREKKSRTTMQQNQ